MRPAGAIKSLPGQVFSYRRATTFSDCFEVLFGRRRRYSLHKRQEDLSDEGTDIRRVDSLQKRGREAGCGGGLPTGFGEHQTDHRKNCRPTGITFARRLRRGDGDGSPAFFVFSTVFVERRNQEVVNSFRDS